MPKGKRVANLARVETYKTLFEQGLMTEDQLRLTVKKSQEDGDLPYMSEKPFHASSPELLEFAKRFGIVRVKKTRVPRADGGSIRQSTGGPSMWDLVKAQHPDVATVVEAAMTVARNVYEITVPSSNGENPETIKVAYQPFWRRVKEKTEATEGATQSEVTV